MSLADTLKQDMNAALKAGDSDRLRVLRLALAAVRQREVDTRATPSDDDVVGLLEKMIKQSRDAIQQFRSAGREELVAKETAEIEVLEAYLPEKLGSEALDQLIAEVLEATGAAGMKDMGRVMGAIKARAAGRVDMAEVNTRVRARLSAG